MAYLESELAFTGSLGGISAYRRRDSDKIILRTKGGAPREMIKSAPSFVNTRRNNREFGGRALMSRGIMMAMLPQRNLADYNLAGPLNALMRPIQRLDQTGQWGERNIRLSANPEHLVGFSLNRKTSFDLVVRSPLYATLDRTACSAEVRLPALVPGVNFMPQPRLPLFRITATLGLVPDVLWAKDKYQETHAFHTIDQKSFFTAWYSTEQGAAADGFSLQVMPLPDEQFSLMLTVGISYGTLADADTIKPVKYTGCAKVLAMG